MQISSFFKDEAVKSRLPKWFTKDDCIASKYYLSEPDRNGVHTILGKPAEEGARAANRELLKGLIRKPELLKTPSSWLL